MVELQKEIVEEAIHEGEAMLLEDLLSLVERKHDDDQPGIPASVLVAYATAMAEARRVGFEPDGVRQELESRMTDEKRWVGPDAIYRLDDERISRFPARWHEELGGSTDVTAYVYFLQEDVETFKDDVRHGGAGPGIPQDDLLEVVAIVGRVDRQTAKKALQNARDEAEVVEDADQHPHAGVYLSDEASELQDETIDG